VPGEVLNILEGHILIEEIGHDRDPEVVRGEELRQARLHETPLHHLPHGVRPVSRRRQLLALPVGRAEEGHLVVLARDTGGVQVFPQPGIQIATDGNLAHLAAFFAEAERPLLAEIPQVAEAQPGDSPDARICVIEYKGDAYVTNDDSKGKRNLGELCASKTEGKGLFLMAEKQDAAGRDTRAQIVAALTS
jgi:hypothetical protein